MPETVCLRGLLRQSVPCWTLETDQGPYFLVGDLSGVRDGDSVYACGHSAQAAFCGPGAALLVTWISTKYGGGPPAPESVVRNVDVDVTQSTRDWSPTFKLEQQPLSLSAFGGQWHGSFAGVQIHGALDFFFMSEGWIDQDFTLSIRATDPSDSTKVWKTDITKRVEKGHVVINDTLDVSNASPQSNESSAPSRPAQ